MFSHEQEQNRYRPSSIADKVNITNKMNKKAPGGDWGLTQKLLQGILGDAKRATCYRWVCLARDLHEEVLNYIKTTRKHLTVGFVADNKFLLGRGESARFKMTTEFACVALDRLFDALDSGKSVSAKQFMEEYCTPMKNLENWHASQVKRFGKIATEFPAYKRVLASLKTEGGRQKLVICATQRLPISGAEYRPHYGIEEARAVMVEMQKMKAGSDPSTHPSGGGDAGGVSPGEASGGVSPGEEKAAMDVDEEEADLLMDEKEEESVVDPVLQKAESLADLERHHISVHVDVGEFKNDVESCVMGSSKPLIVIEAPSSKAKIFNDFLKTAESLKLQQAGYLIPCGHRYDLLSTVMAALSQRFNKRGIFAVQLGSETQTTNTRSGFAVYMAPPNVSHPVPCFVNVAKCRAKASEGLRMRCMDPRCKYRGSGNTDEEDPEAANAELNEDDQEFGGYDPRDMVEEDEATEADLALAQVEGELGSAGAFKRNLWPFASPVAAHAKVLVQVACASSLTHLVVLSRTAHPGLYVAARESKLEVIVLIEGVNNHCIEHGAALLRTMLMGSKFSEAKEQMGGAVTKRIRASTLPFIVVHAPSVQTIRVKEVEPKKESGWRAGLNKRPLSLEEKMVSLLQRELCDHSFTLGKDEEGVLTLYTSKARREGEELFPLRGLLFDTLAGLESFLSEGGCKVLADRLVRVDGVEMDDSDSVSSLYMVMTGLGRFLRHFAGVRRSGPNAVIMVNCGTGAGDGFLSVAVSTRNRQGIAARSPVVINYGNEYDLMFKADTEEPESKRFCGALEKYFQKAVEEARVADEKTGGVSPGTGGVSSDTGGVSPGTGGVTPGAEEKEKAEEAAKKKAEEAKKKKAEGAKGKKARRLRTRKKSRKRGRKQMLRQIR